MSEIKIRELENEDLYKGFLSSLDSLRKASTIQKEKAEEVFQQINQNPHHHVFVAELDGKIIGSITLLIEPKFIHDGGIVGHIEDVVVSKEKQGKGIGEKLVRYAINFAGELGCYKTILDCDDGLIPFYEKVGFKKHSNEMRFDHSD